MDLPPFEEFAYSPLKEKSQFRLVTILPKCYQPHAAQRCLTAENNGAIYCQLLNTKLDSSIQYEALSYCWGDPSRTKCIIIELDNGRFRQLMITETLDVALRSLRKPQLPLTLYIDQICINQEDAFEKNKQVQLMAEIYRRSTCVLGWLGPGTFHSDTFMDFVSTDSGLPSFPPPPMFGAVSWTPVESVVQIDQKLQEDFEKRFHGELAEYWQNVPLEGLFDIVSRAWFRRVWIIQEASLGATMILVCGHKRCCIDCFRQCLGLTLVSLAIRYSVTSGQRSHSSFNEASATGGDAALLSLCASHILAARVIIQDHKTDQWSLLDIVAFFNVVNVEASLVTEDVRKRIKPGATNSRDHIYALWGLADEADEISSKIVVDYTNSEEKVYTDFAAITVETDPDTILFSQPDKNITTLPSWVPDWSSYLRYPSGYLNGKPLFKAGGCISDKKPVRNGRILLMPGVIVDTIQSVGENWMTGKSDVHGRDKSVLPFYIEMGSFCKQAEEISNPLCISSSRGRDETLWLMPTGGVGLLADPSADENATALGLNMEGRPQLAQCHEDMLDRGRYGPLLNQKEEIFQKIVERAHLKIMQSPLVNSPEEVWKLTIDPSGFFWIAFFLVQFYLLKLGVFLAVRREAALYSKELEKRRRTPLAYAAALGKNLNRKCFLTETGFVGLGPKTMKKGDILVLLFGCTTPLVLRLASTNDNQSQEYTLAGEAYCGGIMNGEFLKARSEKKTQIFGII